MIKSPKMMVIKRIFISIYLTSPETKYVKVEVDTLMKIPTDPFSEFLGLIKKLILINSSKHPMLKNDFKKYCIDLFYNNLFLVKNISNVVLKSELHKVDFLHTKFDIYIYKLNFVSF